MIPVIDECMKELESVPDRDAFLEQLVCDRFNKCVESELQELDDQLSNVYNSIDYDNIKSVSKLIIKYSKLIKKTYGKFCNTLLHINKYLNED